MSISAPKQPDDRIHRQTTAGGVRLHAAAETNDAAVQLYGVIPAGVLEPSEIVLLVVKPSVWMIALDSLRTFLIVMAMTFLAVRILPERFELMEPQLIYALALSVMCLKVFWLFTGWLWRVYILTDRRVIVVSGVLKLRVDEQPISRVQGLQVHHTFLESYLGLGTLAFTITDASSALLWRSVANPAQTAEEAWRLIERYTR